MKALLRSVVALVLVAGCEVPEEVPPARPGEPVPTEVTLAEGAEGELLPPPEAGIRTRRRMDVDQLDASLRRVTGGISWVVNGENQLEALSATLGKPDYRDRTTEDLTPSLLFQKFLQDAAHAVCEELVRVDPTRAPAERALLIHVEPTDTLATAPDAVEANLSALLLRFHGTRAEPGSDGMNAWRWLYESAEFVAGEDPTAAWRAVCVGLITHPDFYLY